MRLPIGKPRNDQVLSPAVAPDPAVWRDRVLLHEQQNYEAGFTDIASEWKQRKIVRQITRLHEIAPGTLRGQNHCVDQSAKDLLHGKYSDFKLNFKC
jgi:hypothetical protein